MDLLTTSPAASASASGILSRSSCARSSVNPGEKTRSACNRCHAQKLKCVRKEGQTSGCDRCSRLKTSCRFGPRAARYSRKQPNQGTFEITMEDPQSAPASMSMSIPNPETTIGVTSEIDWLSSLDRSTFMDKVHVTQTNPNFDVPDFVDEGEMCWGTFFGSESIVDHPLVLEGSPTPVRDSFANTNAIISPATLDPCMKINEQDLLGHITLTPQSKIQRLASLDVALDGCGLKLPLPFKAGPTSAETGTRKSRIFALDELLRLTTEFLDILTWPSQETGQSQFIVPPSSAAQRESNLASKLQIFKDDEGFFRAVDTVAIEESPNLLSPRDEATMFMVMACHSRLTKIYDSVFQMMQACIEHSLAPRTDKDWVIILPQLQVGSITSPPLQVDIDTPVSPATSSMYMLMITMVFSQIWAQLADKMSVSGGMLAKMSSRATLTQTVWDKIVDKNDRLMQTISNIRQRL